MLYFSHYIFIYIALLEKSDFQLTNLFIFRLFQPFLIFRILLFFDQNSLEENKTDVYIYAILLIILSALSVSISHYFSLQAAQVGMKMRIACSSLIYRKALKLNQKAFVKTSTGQIVNLLSNDVGRLENTIHLNHLFMAPIETLVVMVLIYFSVGWYGLIGALCLIASMFLTCKNISLSEKLNITVQQNCYIIFEVKFVLLSNVQGKIGKLKLI